MVNFFTLVFAPWVSAKTVRRAYYRARGHLDQGENHNLTEKALAVLSFVAEQTEEHGERPPWKELRKRWNRRYADKKEWRYKSIQGLRQACLRAEIRLGILERTEPVGKKPEVKELLWYLEEDDTSHEDTNDDNP